MEKGAALGKGPTACESRTGAQHSTAQRLEAKSEVSPPGWEGLRGRPGMGTKVRLPCCFPQHRRKNYKGETCKLKET